MFARERRFCLITPEIIKEATGLDCNVEHLNGIGDLYANHASSILSYISSRALIPALLANKRITHVFCTDDVLESLPDKVISIKCVDPIWSFFSLVDFLAKTRKHNASDIALDSLTDGSYIAKRGVSVRSGVILQPFCSVHEATFIGEDTIVRSGAAIGLDSFQHQKTKLGIISPRHDGSLVIGKRVEIGASTSISKGFSYRDTTIDDDVKIDCNVSISHGVRIGKGSIICAGALILGHSVIGENVFLGPGAVLRNRIVIGDGARVSMGSIVTKDVLDGETVTGNFAVSHEAWLAFVKTVAKYDECITPSIVKE